MNLVKFHEKSFTFRQNPRQNEKEVPGARGFRVIFSQFAYVYGVFSVMKCGQGSPTMIGSSIQRLVGLHVATGRDARIFEVPRGWMVASGGIPGPAKEAARELVGFFMKN